MAKNMNFKEGGKRLRELLGEISSPITLYTVNESVTKSNMSAVISVYVIIDNEPELVAYGKVSGCGLDRGFEACYNIFRYAYPNLPYQKYLKHRWL